MKKENKNPVYFGLTNDIIFGWIMKSEENCLAIIRAILSELNIISIVHKEIQHDITPVDSTRGVRFDAVVKDDQERYYDIEMQVENTGDLGRHARYYQSQIDNETLMKGQTFHKLKESFVIFLCAFDPFNYGLRRYQFHQYEDTIRDLRLDTHEHVLFTNSKGTEGEVSNDLAGIIDVMNQKPNQANPLASKLMKEIDYYNQDSEKRRELMDYATRLLDERLIGEKIGEEKGRQEGRIETTNRNARNIIIAFKANQAEPSYIFQFVKNAFKDDFTDEEIQQMIDDVEDNE
ncbi:Rpn family recombination-promoting nuclease/putative transposase [Enterococcus cecorum]|uniref:Rpn family recombination-promoting nuclease/putative transposase n=1 Tax=Enterococcus cecorum TaxID=44008 RepID=UPI0009BDF3E6|nr:Rpn family recombination-promoting nuclease/putative transposase [Enterococcus cecorum]MDZ5547044.1 Rpn family recombination-promoting nuclease/putative transposase [Enterococcus cecorum]MDZ5575920.1 Rpn family recombination-promoting nuclease/putative transposase [Enterococcus cecorum]MDZ5582168.1 Rpn family recombination-promoting nuclease/putative transposase [Enterococcus cecorum]MDZ5592922.1 Rpn family recombination-promoting nuclease/putative transposase [Enterococcus cecorum]